MTQTVYQYGPNRGKPKPQAKPQSNHQAKQAQQGRPCDSDPLRSYKVFSKTNKHGRDEWFFTFTDKIYPDNCRTYGPFPSRDAAITDLNEHRTEFKRIETDIDTRNKQQSKPEDV